jgi:addiction module RelB/DinJ family antitoxin
VLSACGLEPNDAIRLFLQQVVAHQGIPFDIRSAERAPSKAELHGLKRQSQQRDHRISNSVDVSKGQMLLLRPERLRGAKVRWPAVGVAQARLGCPWQSGARRTASRILTGACGCLIFSDYRRQPISKKVRQAPQGAPCPTYRVWQALLADFDGDGDLDFIVNNDNAPALYYVDDAADIKLVVGR